MSYNFKGQKIIINGEEQIIVPGTLPSSPTDGMYAIDSADGKLKTYNETKGRWIILGDAFDIHFESENTTPSRSNGFQATNAQEAIEEAYSTAVAKPRFSIITTFNGTVSHLDWLGYNNLIPGDQVPIKIPRNCKLREITFAYKNTDLLGIPTGSNLIDGTFRLYRNGFSNPGDVIFTEQFIDQPSGKVVTGLNLTLDEADFIVGRWIDQGSNPSDMAVCYFFEVT